MLASFCRPTKYWPNFKFLASIAVL